MVKLRPAPAERTVFSAPGTKPFWRVGIFFVLNLMLATGSEAAGVDARAEYVVSLAGLNVATVSADFSDDGGSYAIDIGAKVSGVGNLVASGTANVDSQGSSSNGRLSARDFNLMTRARGEEFKVDVQYASGNATGFQVHPPAVDAGRVALERKHLAGVADPIASFVIKANALSPDLCDRRLKVFTGMERYDIQMSFGAMQDATSPRTGYQGPVVLCRLKYIPISGHFTNSEMTEYLANSEKILVWYAPLQESGYYIPYRVLLGTSAGDLSMVLTALR